MGQTDIVELLKMIRFNDPERWLTIREIKDELILRKSNYSTVKNCYEMVYKLAIFNQIECKGEGFMHHEKLFRARP